MKVAILGAESSHAATFAKILAGKDGSRRYEDVELVGFYADKDLSDSEEGIELIRKWSSCDYVTNDYEEFVGKVDAVIITSRHGSKHLGYARPYLERGIPVWVDKPIASNVSDALEMVALAKQYDTTVSGGSVLVTSPEIKELAAYVKENRATVRGGHVTAPIQMESPYEGFWFYSAHAVQMMLEVFGPGVRRVKAERGKNYVQAVYVYDEFNVTVYFGTGYTVTLYRTGGQADPVKVSTGSSEELLDEFFEIVRTGHNPQDPADWIAPVVLVDATIRAYETGEWVEL